MNSLRFCFVLSSLHLSGGVRLVIEYANGLAARGHAITLVTPGGTVDPALREMLAAGVELSEIRTPLPAKPTPLSLLRLVLALARAIPRSDVLVATHTPTVVPTLLAARTNSGARTAWLYMDYPEMFRGRPVESLLLRHAPRWFDQVWTISHPLQRAVSERTHKPVVTTGAGLTNAHLLFNAKRAPEPGESPRILYVGDPRPRKGLREFLQAMERVAKALPTITPVIVSKTETPIELSIPHELHLFPSNEKLAELYASSDLFVSTSWGEGLGYPPLEAMACGTPTVITNSDGVLDYARDGENCLLVPPRDPGAVTEASLRLLGDSALAASIVAAGRATAARYTWDAVIDRIEHALA